MVRSFGIHILVIAGLTCLYPSAYAQSEKKERRVLEEVIVTAQKKSESIRDVPISIMALSKDFMVKNGISDMNDLALHTPNVTVDVSTSVGFLTMRGLGSGTNKGLEQSVGLVIDGIYYSRLAYISDGLLDLERAEVLRGPQGTLFGKNTVAGAFNITTGSPTDTLEGYFYGTAGSGGFSRLRAVVSGPLIKNIVNVRVAAAAESFDGLIFNTASEVDPSNPNFEGNINNPHKQLKDKDNFTGRIKANFPSLANGLDLSVGYTRAEVSQNSLGAEIYQASDTTRDIYTDFDPQFEAELNDVSSSGDRTFATRETDTYTLHADYEIGDHLFSGIASYSKYDTLTLQDGDIGAIHVADLFNDDTFSQQSLELRIASSPGPLEYVAGLYYFGSNLDGLSKIGLDMQNTSRILIAENTPISGPAGEVLGDILGVVTSGAPLGEENNRREFKQLTDSRAIFGQATWHVGDRLTLMLGGRYTVEEKTLDLALTHSSPFGAAAFNFGLGEETNIFVDDRMKKESNFSPKISAIYDFTDDINFYATYAQAFKAGGFNEQTANGDPENLEYDAEGAVTYEVGTKMVLDDGAATFNFGLFHTNFRDLQVSLFDGTRFTVSNAADATSEGIEADFNWLPTRWLTLGGAGALLDASYTNYPGAQCPAESEQDTCDLSGESLTRAPTFSGTLNAQIELPLTSQTGLQFAWDLNFIDDVFLTADNDPAGLQEGYATHNFRLSYGTIEEHWSLTYFLYNAFDKRYLVGANDVPLQPGTHAGVLNLGRRHQLELRMSF